jgi:hypothetical protein
MFGNEGIVYTSILVRVKISKASFGDVVSQETHWLWCSGLLEFTLNEL